MSLKLASHIAYVNLDHRTDRLELMKGELAKHDIQAVRRRGILPHERQSDKLPMAAMLRRKQVGALGCYLAQVDIIKEALALGKHAWVMEDDLHFCQDFNDRIDYITDWSTQIGLKSWDIIWLGGTFHVNPPHWYSNSIGRDAELTADPRMIRTYGSFCTYCYIVNYFSIQKVLDLMGGVIEKSIGIDHSMIMISPSLNTYAFVPGCVKQIDNLSDQVPGSGDWTMFSKFDKLGPYWFQENMNDFDPSSFDWKEAKIGR